MQCQGHVAFSPFGIKQHNPVPARLFRMIQCLVRAIHKVFGICSAPAGPGGSNTRADGNVQPAFNHVAMGIADQQIEILNGQTNFLRQLGKHLRCRAHGGDGEFFAAVTGGQD